jgi:hypothetical protein
MKRVTFAVLAILAASSAYGAVGDLAYKPADPDQVSGGPELTATRAKITPAPEGSGLVNPGAQVATLGEGDSKILVAFDSAKPEDFWLNAVRIDGSGAGKFADAQPIPLVLPPSGKAGNATFGPAEVKLKLGGKTITATVAGRCYMTRSGPLSVQLALGIILEGQCAFGDQVRTVRLADQTGNLRVDDPVKTDVQEGTIRGVTGGDLLLVDDGDGKAFSSCYSGQPVRVGEKWFKVQVSADQSKVTAVPLDVPMGKIKVEADTWALDLLDAGQVLHVEGGPGAVTVPAGKFIILVQRLRKGDTTIAISSADVYSGRAKPMDVPADKTTALAVGGPLEAKAAVTQEGRSVSLMLQLTDVGGRPVRAILTKAGQDPGAYEILDTAGKRVDYATIEYS